jgi:peptide deformylase
MFGLIKAAGFSLSAIQIGVDLRFIVVNTPFLRKCVMINPEIIELSRPLVPTKEACHSVPLASGLETLRSPFITVKYLDLDMKEQIRSLQMIDAAIVQHECDHLNGQLFLARLTNASKNSWEAKLKARNKSGIDKFLDDLNNR